MNPFLYSIDHLATYRGLMERMERALGIDLEAALADGQIDGECIARLKLRCALCDQPDACARLLAAQPILKAAPDYCVNSKALTELAPEGTAVR